MTLFLLFLALHSSILGLSWLIERSYIPVFTALKVVMLRLRRGAKPVRMSGVVESDEICITSGLKGRSNSARMRRLGRRRGLRRRGCEAWKNDKPPIFILVEGDGCEGYLPSTDVWGGDRAEGVGRRVSEGSEVYTDIFKPYNCLGRLATP